MTASQIPPDEIISPSVCPQHVTEPLLQPCENMLCKLKSAIKTYNGAPGRMIS